MTGDWTPRDDRAIEPLEVVVLIGLQGSGKSTFFRQRYGATHALVSRDLFRNNPHPSRRQRELIGAALLGGRSLVVDNTNPTRADRAAIVAIAREHGARVVGYWFGRDIRAAIARNARREGKQRVPVVGILATAKRLVAPSWDEGFDELYAVEPSAGGEFTVRPLGEAGPAPGGGGATGSPGQP